MLFRSEVLPEQTLRVAAGLTHWICENARSARALLKRIGQTHPLAAPLQAQDIQELPRNAHKKGDHDARQDDGAALRRLLAPALAGHDMGLLSEAGMPAVADPGSSVVRQAHALGIALLESIENDDPTALVGLPLIRTARMLRAAGVRLL